MGNGFPRGTTHLLNHGEFVEILTADFVYLGPTARLKLSLHSPLECLPMSQCLSSVVRRPHSPNIPSNEIPYHTIPYPPTPYPISVFISAACAMCLCLFVCLCGLSPVLKVSIRTFPQNICIYVCTIHIYLLEYHVP